MKTFIVFASLFVFGGLTFSQTPDNRIRYENQDLFLSGANVAWVNFARDIGPSNTNFTKFKSIFTELKANGGNSMRLWLHTTGHETPAFDATGKVTGPGTNAIADLKQILDLAYEQKVGLQLCLWSFDMLRISNGAGITDRAKKLLTDTVYTNAYIKKALIPIVNGVKGHPGILAWEVFNEPEGMSNEFGWEFNHHIPMLDIQRVVNLVAGAIHRTDSSAIVTNGAWCFRAQTDVSFDGNPNKNYYRDDRLIAAGGDPDGTLDFYNVHYYQANFGAPLSPFHHPKSAWGLDKPLVVAEFYIEDSHGKTWQGLYRNLIENGYAGAWSWAWDIATQNARTKVSMLELKKDFASDVVIEPRSGVILNFRVDPPIIENGDSALLSWDSSNGSVLLLDGESVPQKGRRVIHPSVPTEFTLTSSGDVAQEKKTTVGFYPSGKLWSFTAKPVSIAAGDPVTLTWTSSFGSTVTLNGEPVPEDGSMTVNPLVTTLYKLTASGVTTETLQRTVTVLPADQVNRANGRPVTVSGTETGTGHENPAHMVDDDPPTWWASLNTELNWVELDLVDTIAIDKIKITWGGTYATTYRLGISSDRKNWKVILWEKAGTGGLSLIDSIGVTGRYVRLLLDKRSKTTTGYQISELQVYGLKVTATDVESAKNEKMTDFVLFPNYPNPFNPETTLRFSIPAAGEVSVSVMNLIGQTVWTSGRVNLQAGSQQILFSGDSFPSGVYVYRISLAGNNRSQSVTGKMVLLK
ncbi:MAG: discoidin domain-containing protein [Bacteroidetes bacterium]|nr:discoidin domain-containing protein [Bacteroidota bacterium]